MKDAYIINSKASFQGRQADFLAEALNDMLPYCVAHNYDTHLLLEVMDVVRLQLERTIEAGFLGIDLEIVTWDSFFNNKGEVSMEEKKLSAEYYKTLKYACRQCNAHMEIQPGEVWHPVCPRCSWAYQEYIGFRDMINAMEHDFEKSPLDSDDGAFFVRLRALLKTWSKSYE